VDLSTNNGGVHQPAPQPGSGIIPNRTQPVAEKSSRCLLKISITGWWFGTMGKPWESRGKIMGKW